MFKFIMHMLVSVIVFSSTGCASIVSKSQWPVKIDTNPSGAKYEISDSNGAELHSGTTPMLVTLKSSQGFFSSAKYSISCQKEGFIDTKTQIRAHLNGWYWGNIVFGGVIGLLIVDPATGAMWKLEEAQMVRFETQSESLTALNANPDPGSNITQDRKIHLKKDDTLAVLPFTINAAQTSYSHLSQGFSDDLTYYLLKNDGLTVLDRNTVDKALNELKFSNSTLVDSATTQNIGRFLGAKFLVLGNVEIVGDDASIVCRVIKVETCENVISEKVSGRANDLFALREQLGKKMNSRFLANGG